MVLPQNRTLQVIGNDRDLDPGNGPRTGTFDDAAGRAAQRNAEGTVIQRSMNLGKPTDAARVRIRAESQKRAVL
jgi:hypothetical protein